MDFGASSAGCVLDLPVKGSVGKRTDREKNEVDAVFQYRTCNFTDSFHGRCLHNIFRL